MHHDHNLLTFPSPSQHSSFEQLDPESKTWKQWIIHEFLISVQFKIFLEPTSRSNCAAELLGPAFGSSLAVSQLSLWRRAARGRSGRVGKVVAGLAAVEMVGLVTEVEALFSSPPPSGGGSSGLTGNSEPESHSIL